MHPPPVSLLSALLLPVLIFAKPCLTSVNKYFSYLIFWLENLVMILLFFFYELLISPVVYGKIFYNLITST